MSLLAYFFYQEPILLVVKLEIILFCADYCRGLFKLVQVIRLSRMKYVAIRKRADFPTNVLMHDLGYSDAPVMSDLKSNWNRILYTI